MLWQGEAHLRFKLRKTQGTGTGEAIQGIEGGARFGGTIRILNINAIMVCQTHWHNVPTITHLEAAMHSPCLPVYV
jgi:hypothetical protein